MPVSGVHPGHLYFALHQFGLQCAMGNLPHSGDPAAGIHFMVLSVVYLSAAHE
jgi:hypothetical protein